MTENTADQLAGTTGGWALVADYWDGSGEYSWHRFENVVRLTDPDSLATFWTITPSVMHDVESIPAQAMHDARLTDRLCYWMQEDLIDFDATCDLIVLDDVAYDATQIDHRTAAALTHDVVEPGQDVLDELISAVAEHGGDVVYRAMSRAQIVEPAPRSLAHAVVLVALDVIANQDDDETGGVTAAIGYARDVLRLPEEPFVIGSYPIEEDGTTLAQAYRMVLEADVHAVSAVI